MNSSTLHGKAAMAIPRAAHRRKKIDLPGGPELGKIVADQTFIVATRDTGYRDLTAAIAELIDNALQAEATNIEVFVEEDAEALPADDGSPTIRLAVVDNGSGMGPETLRRALQFGGTNRFNDRSGLGRFGMGLPNSSMSQTRRLEVYSWHDGNRPYYTYLDVDEVSSGRLQSIPIPVTGTLPYWLGRETGVHGTAVLWSRCDRLGRNRAPTIAQRLESPLGRIYRFALWDGTTIRINGKAIGAVDPLYMRGTTPFNQGTAYGNRLRYEINSLDTERTSIVEVQFSELPILKWHSWSIAQKRRAGLVGGAGVSIVRAGREIDYGWHLMGAKRRENYDDWWRCEIRFSPALDELFGVTHSKQGVSPRQALKNILGPDLESIARALNARARTAFASLKDHTRTVASELASDTDRFQLAPSPLNDHVDGLRYRIAVAKLDSPDFYAISLEKKTLTITVNEEHPFFRKLYQPACRPGHEQERFGLECMLLGAARADVALTHGYAQASTLLKSRWSDTLAVLLDRSTVR